MAEVRLPSVREHVWVVLRRNTGNGSGPPSMSELDAFRVLQPTPKHSSSHSEPLKLGAIEVVAMYAIVPPAPPAVSTKPSFQRYQMLRSMLMRLIWVVPLIRYGLTVPFWAFLWMFELVTAAERCRRSKVFNHKFHDLQVMCVAKDLQGQGIGTAVMRLIQDELKQSKDMCGLKGLCQSEETREFYVKQGFQADAVYSHAYSRKPDGNLRTHWLVTWQVPSKVQGM
jgi:GNAT superfamily N-acetyltransferase